VTAAEQAPVREWLHSRKGRIRGTVVREDDVWVTIRLAGDHALRYASQGNRGRVDEDGEPLVVRRSLLTEIGVAS
jgi:hypothetical protein